VFHLSVEHLHYRIHHILLFFLSKYNIARVGIYDYFLGTTQLLTMQVYVSIFYYFLSNWNRNNVSPLFI